MRKLFSLFSVNFVDNFSGNAIIDAQPQNNHKPTKIMTKNKAYIKIAQMMAAAGINRAANRELNAYFANRIYRAECQDLTRLLKELADEMVGRGAALHKQGKSFAEVRAKVLAAAGI